jgi:DNA-binding NtrC family response regulator
MLLRAVEAHEVFRVGSTTPTRFRARFIAASNRDLAAQVSAGIIFGGVRSSKESQTD